MRTSTTEARELRGASGSSGHWLAFAVGLAAGVGLSALLVGGALAERRRPRTLPWSRGRRSAPVLYPPALDEASFEESDAARAARNWPEDDSLDDELEQTFPASDPLPYSHRVD